ncbi:benzoate/H(+) symporter BenE family transporter [Pantoea ananatis]
MDVDPRRRWIAAALGRFFYLLAGFSGALIAVLFSALPAVMVQVLAGLALLATLGGSLQRALEQPEERDSALIAFLITASGVTLCSHRRGVLGPGRRCGCTSVIKA